MERRVFEKFSKNQKKQFPNTNTLLSYDQS